MRLEKELEADGEQEAPTRPEERFFDRSPDACLITSADGHIIAVNRAASGLLNRSGEDLAGLSIWDLIEHSSEEAHQRLGRVGAAGSAQEWEGAIRLPEDERIAVSIRVGRLGGGPDQPERLAWVIRDLTESQLRHQALRESEQRLETLNSLKDTFLRSVSHDLRGPLAAVIGLAQTLVREDIRLDPADEKDLLERLLKSASQMKALLTDLLDLDRLSEGYLGTSNEPVDLDELAARSVEDLDPARQDGVELRPSRLVAAVDRAVLQRIVANLLDNALRYTTSDGRVWLTFQAQAGRDLLLSVDDDGPGIEENAKEAIFDPFVRAPAASSVAGTGMGLALVERFAGLLGGRAWVEDRPGGGASFKVLLPGCLEIQSAAE